MNLYEKMVAVMRDVSYLRKDDKVEFGRTSYKAMSEEKVTSIMHEQLVKRGLAVFPVKQVWSRDGQITHVDVTYRIVNAEDPAESIEVVSCGDGYDTQDKGAGKAMTYAFKYMFLRTFAIPTGEDPDKVSSDEIDAKIAAQSENKQVQQESKPAPKEPAQFLCSECGELIRPMAGKDGREISVRGVYAQTQKKFGRPLCEGCARKASALETLKNGA